MAQLESSGMDILRKIKRIASVFLSAALVFPLVSCAEYGVQGGDDGKFNIVTSFYPVQILVVNVAGGIDGVEIDCMSDSNLGCIHDHVFTTDDLRLIENADVYVENGLGLEMFNDQILAAYPDLPIIEAAAEVTDAPSDGDEVNGHVWTSIDDYILEINEVSSRLSELDPVHASEYEANAGAYIARINELTADYSDVIASVAGQKVLVLDESLPSFCVYLGIDYVTIVTDHEQSALSAGHIGETIGYMNDNGINAIFVAPGDESGVADSIAAETGASIYEINTVLTGEVYEDAYLDQMEHNFEVLGNLG